MARSNHIFARASNRLFDLLSESDIGELLPSENALSSLLDVSRSTIRSALQYAADNGVISSGTLDRRLLRRPTEPDYFGEHHLTSRPEIIERQFLHKIQKGELKVGQGFSESELARDSQASTAAVREFLIRFSRFGLVEKRQRGGWVLRGFDAEYADELAEMRSMIELAALDRIEQMGLGSADLAFLEDTIARHEAVAADIAGRYREFPDLDREFHEWLIRHLNNRFTLEFFTGVSFIFHFHYQVDRSLERELNTVAIGEHLAALRNLAAGDFASARASLASHLATSRRALVQSMVPSPQAFEMMSTAHRKPGVRSSTR